MIAEKLIEKTFPNYYQPKIAQYWLNSTGAPGNTLEILTEYSNRKIIITRIKIRANVSSVATIPIPVYVALKTRNGQKILPHAFGTDSAWALENQIVVEPEYQVLDTGARSSGNTVEFELTEIIEPGVILRLEIDSASAVNARVFVEIEFVIGG